MSTETKRGRPRREDLYKGHIRAAEDKVADRLGDLVDNLLQLASGYWTEEKLKDGTRRVYQEPPDRASNEYLINRIMGKPTEPVDVTSDGESVAPRFFERIRSGRDGPVLPSAEANGVCHD